MADTVTPISSFTDPRGAMPTRPADTQLVKITYGPYTIPAASGSTPGQIHNAANFNAPAPCTNCRITDMVPDLVDNSGNSQNLQQGVMMHHFVLVNPERSDIVCPGGLQGGLGERFFAAGNERTELHLPGNFGYENSRPNWTLIYHLVNRSSSPKTVNIQVIYAYRSKAVTQQAVPAWLDIDGCSDSEYSIPTGYSDFHDVDNLPAGGPYSADWTLPWDAHLIGISGHQHDVDITTTDCDNNTDDDAAAENPGTPTPDGKVNDGCAAIGAAESGANCNNATDDDSDGKINDGCPQVGNVPEGPCTIRCPTKGGGIAVSAELRGGTATDYFGPSPPNNPRPADLTGATLCRSEDNYATPFGTPAWNGHLDTMSECGIFTDIPPTAQPEAYPVGGAYPADGYPLKRNQIIRLHSEYQNRTGINQTDVMGIMMAWLAVNNPFPRPGGGTPLRVPLVPEYSACTSPNSTHIGPLSNPSCTPPVEASSVLTTSTTGKQNGSVLYKVQNGNPATQADEADVNITSSITDVKKRSDGTDYVGKVLVTSTMRMTDNSNGPAAQGTVQDTQFQVPLNCMATTDTTVGSTCSVTTTADTLVPGMIRETTRTIMSLLSVNAKDAGPNGTGYGAGCPTTCGDGDETVFMRQGVFAP